MSLSQEKEQRSRGGLGTMAKGLATAAAFILIWSGCRVKAPELESISVSPKNPAVTVGDSLQFSADGVYSDDSSVELSSGVTWTSSRETVAVIGSDGLAETLKAGTSTITAVYENLKGTTILTVEPYNPELGGWQAAGSLSTARFAHSGGIFDGVLYAVGGFDGSVVLSAVEYAASDSDGGLSDWQIGSSLPLDGGTGRSHHGGFAYNGYLYVFGGVVLIPPSTTDIRKVSINSDGSLGSWGNEANSMIIGRMQHAVVEHGGFVYVTGGTTDTVDYLTEIEYAPIDGSGNIGSWTGGTILPDGRYWHGSFAHGGYLYVVGGLSSGGILDDVIRISIEPDGSLGGTWEEAKEDTGDTLPRKRHACIVNRGFVYIIGGTDDTNTELNSVIYAPILENGLIGDWVTAASPFPTARKDHTAEIYNGFLYVVGGSDSEDTTLNDVQYAPFNP